MQLLKRTLKLILFILLFMPVSRANAQENSTQNTIQAETVLKEHKSPDAEFFQFEIKKLSLSLLVRLLLNFLTAFVLIRLIYLTSGGETEIFRTFFIFNFIIFLITYLLSKVELSMGAAFGLFAVFSILRFRTEGITTRDMTYLFLVIAVGLVNAVGKGTIIEVMIIDAAVLLLSYGLEGNLILKRKELSQAIVYDNLELLKPQNRAQLIDDLKNKTGLPITRVAVTYLNFSKNSGELKIYYSNI